MTLPKYGQATEFDGQAATFDARAGLPASVRAAVAASIATIGRLGPGRLVLDVGAGTGDIGLELVRSGYAYMGIDSSEAMLDAFRQRAAELELRPRLTVADAERTWPLGDGTVAVVFGSRSLHPLHPSHVAAETFRVTSAPGAAGAVLLVGRVIRGEASPRGRIRRKMREILAGEGYAGRSGANNAAELILECERRGATRLASRTVAAWTVLRTPRASLDAWASKPSLAGIEVPEDVKRRVLAQVAEWAPTAFGDIDTELESSEEYVLEGAVLGTASGNSRT